MRAAQRRRGRASAAGRAARARPVRLRDLLGSDVTDDVVTWARTGAPGVADPPDLLDLFVLAPPRQVRRHIDG